MRETDPDGGAGELRPERFGGTLRLRPERFGLDAGPAGGAVRGAGGWALDEQGMTTGRILRFADAGEMRELVAELRSVIDGLEARRSDADREGPVVLTVFLAAHRIEAGGD